MALSTSGIAPRLYGKGGRKVYLPIKAGVQIYEGNLVSQINGACVPSTTAGAGDAIGMAEKDALGGAADGSKRVSIFTDQIFLLAAGIAAPTDFTPFGAFLFCEDDHTVGTGGLGASQVLAGRFVGIEDDGSVRCYISEAGAAGDYGSFGSQVAGTALTAAASQTVQRVGRVSRYVLSATLTQNITVTLGTTGAVKGDILRILRTSVDAFTVAVNNGGAGAGTIATLPASKIGDVQAWFDGTNWLFDGASSL